MPSDSTRSVVSRIPAVRFKEIKAFQELFQIDQRTPESARSQATSRRHWWSCRAHSGDRDPSRAALRSQTGTPDLYGHSSHPVELIFRQYNGANISKLSRGNVSPAGQLIRCNLQGDDFQHGRQDLWS